MMEITEIRRANVRALMNAFTDQGRTKKDFAAKIGIESPQLIHITAEPPSRNIGDRIARRVEVNLKLPRGWLDVIQNVERYSQDINRDGRFITNDVEAVNGIFTDPIRADFTLVELSEDDFSEDMKLNTGPDAIQALGLSDEHARALFGGRSGDELRLYTHHGDSMKGTIEPGETVVIDITRSDFSTDGIYLFVYEGRLNLKRLQRIKKILKVIPDNPKYESWTIEPDDHPDLEIIGLLIGKWDFKYSRLG